MSEPVARKRPPYIAVIGDGDPRGPDSNRILEWAEEVGSDRVVMLGREADEWDAVDALVQLLSRTGIS